LIFKVSTFIAVATLLVMPGLVTHAQSNAQVKESTTSRCDAKEMKRLYSQYEESLPNSDHFKAAEAARDYLSCPTDSSITPKALADMNFVVGESLFSRGSPASAIPFLINAVSYDTPLKASPIVYCLLGRAYEEGPYVNVSDSIKRRYQAKDDTDAKEFAKLLEVVDRIIDAYARAAAAHLSDPERLTVAHLPDSKYYLKDEPCAVKNDLNEFYKFRNKGSDKGLKELIATVLSRPIPAPPSFLAIAVAGPK
jgi:hypothetical protein